MADRMGIHLSCLLAGGLYECMRDLRVVPGHVASRARGGGGRARCARIEDCLYRRDKIRSLNSQCVRTRTICQRIYSAPFHPEKRYRLNSIDVTIHKKSSKVIN